MRLEAKPSLDRRCPTETGVEILAAAKQLAGQHFGILQLVEMTARLNRLVEFVSWYPACISSPRD